MYIWHYKSTSTIMFTIMFCVSQCMLYDNSLPWRQLIFWYLAWSSACLGSSNARATTLGGMLCCTSVAVDATSLGALAAALWGKLSYTSVATGNALSGFLHHLHFVSINLATPTCLHKKFWVICEEIVSIVSSLKYICLLYYSLKKIFVFKSLEISKYIGVL